MPTTTVPTAGGKPTLVASQPVDGPKHSCAGDEIRWRPLESVRIEEAQRRKRDVRVIKKDVWKWRFFRCVPLRFEPWMEDAHKWDAIQQWNSGVGDRMPIFDHYPVWSRDPDQVAKPCHAPRQEEGQLEVWPSCSHRIVLLFQRFFCFGHGVP